MDLRKDKVVLILLSPSNIAKTVHDFSLSIAVSACSCSVSDIKIIHAIGIYNDMLDLKM